MPMSQVDPMWISMGALALLIAGMSIILLAVRQHASLRSLREIEDALSRRDLFLRALSAINCDLLPSASEVPAQTTLNVLAPAVAADRACFWLNERGLDDASHLSLKAEWVPARSAAEPGCALPLQWLDQLYQGHTVCERVGPTSDDERLPLAHRGTGMALIVPLIVDGGFAGAMGFERKGQDAAWGNAEVDFLRTAAVNLAQAIKRTRAEETAQRLAIRDPLSGLYNRRYLEDALSRAGAFSKRYNRPMAVIWVDLDHFKDINDALGHTTGDRILAEFAALLTGLTRASDIVARYGGDEFIVVIPEGGGQEAVGLAQRITQVVREHLFSGGGQSFRITVSMGIATNEPNTQNTSHEDLMENADQAMYRAKQKGRDQFLVWSATGDLEAYGREGQPSGTLPDLPAAQAAGKTPAPCVLVVDDDPSITAALERILKDKGCEVVTLSSGRAALDVLSKNPGRFDLVLSDIDVPDIDGLALLDEVRALDESIVRIVITGLVTADHAIAALRHGAYDFIQKPFVIEQFHAVLHRALEYRRLVSENLKAREHLKDMVRAKSEEVVMRLDQLKTSYQFTLETMAAMLDTREHGVGRHSARVRDLMLLLAGRMGVQPPELEEMGRGALVHDIGKIGIPDAILNKPGALSPDEWKIMKTHPEIGYRFLESSSFLKIASTITPAQHADVHIFPAFVKTAANIVYSHHEKYDGSGYPRGLKGEEISLGARIFSVIDAYDAMRSSRVYRKAMGRADAVEEIRRGSGTHFDPSVVRVFLESLDEIEQIGKWPEPAVAEPVAG